MRTQRVAGPLVAVVILMLLAKPALAQDGGGQLWRFDAGGRVQSASVTGDGQRIVLGARDNLARAFDRSGKLAWQFPAANSVLGVDVSPDGRWTAVASEDRNVYLLDEAGKPLWQHKAERAMNNAAVADDGSLVAATSDDRSFYVLDGKGNLIWHDPLGIDVRGVAIYGSGEDARVVIGSDDGYVTIYSRTGDQLLQTRLDYDVRSVAVTPNGGRIAAGTSDGLVTLLDGATGKRLWSYKTGRTVNSVALSSDGRTVLTGSDDKQAYLLDGDGKLVQAFKPGGDVLAVALSGDGQLLVLGTSANAAQVLDRGAAQASQAASQTRQGGTLAAAVFGLAVVVAASAWAVRRTARGGRLWQRLTAGPRDLGRRMWQARLSYALILPTLLLLLTFNYYPAFSGLYHAFTEWNPGARTEWVGLANFELLLRDRFFISSFQNTIILVIVQILKTLTVPLLVAELVFSLRHDRTRYWLRTLFIVPLVLPVVVEILLWNNIYDPTIGLLNQTLIALGKPEWARTWYGDANVALGSVIFIGFPWVSAFALLIFYGGLIGISEEIFDSSRVDGANGLQRFLHIDLPMLMGQVKLLLILNFISAIQTFEVVYLTTGAAQMRIGLGKNCAIHGSLSINEGTYVFGIEDIVVERVPDSHDPVDQHGEEQNPEEVVAGYEEHGEYDEANNAESSALEVFDEDYGLDDENGGEDDEYGDDAYGEEGQEEEGYEEEQSEAAEEEGYGDEEAPEEGGEDSEPDDNLAQAEPLLGDIPMVVVVELGRVQLTADEVIRLRPGQLVEVGRKPNDLLVDLVVNGKLVAKGKLVEIEGALGVELASLVGADEG